jgi:hypothetical protein
MDNDEKLDELTFPYYDGIFTDEFMQKHTDHMNLESFQRHAMTQDEVFEEDVLAPEEDVYVQQNTSGHFKTFKEMLEAAKNFKKEK